MAGINSQHLNLYRGELAEIVIPDGLVNNLFDDIDDVQFVEGGTRIKDIWFGVNSPNADALFRPRAMILTPPGDDDQIVTLATHDTREEPDTPIINELSDVPIARIQGTAEYAYSEIADEPTVDSDQNGTYFEIRIDHDQRSTGAYFADPDIILENREDDEVAFAIQGQSSFVPAGSIIQMFGCVLEVIETNASAFSQNDAPPIAEVDFSQETTDEEHTEGLAPGKPFYSLYRWGTTPYDSEYSLTSRTVDESDVVDLQSKNFPWMRIKAKLLYEPSVNDFTTNILASGRIQEGVAKFVEYEPQTQTIPDDTYYGVTGVTAAPVEDDTTLSVAEVEQAIDEAPTMASIFREGSFILLHHTDYEPLPDPYTPDQSYALPRNNLAFIALRDSTGLEVATDLYDVDLVAGAVTIPSTSDMSDYTGPFTVEHRIEQYNFVTTITGTTLGILRGLRRDFPADSLVSSVYLPDIEKIEATAEVLYDMDGWNGEWNPASPPAEADAETNEEQHPIAMLNAHAIPQDWRIEFTDEDNFDLYGKDIGLVASGARTATFAPENPTTGGPFMSIEPEFFGAGWSAGDGLRFRTDPAKLPIEIRRVVLFGIPPDTESARILVAGSINQE